MIKWLKQIDTLPKQVVMLACVVFIMVVGLTDYATGYETFFFTFYLLAIFAATWRVSVLFGVLMSGLSVTAWISANIEAGAHYSSYFVPVWNATILFAIYLIIVFLLAGVKKMNQELEERVRLRTAAMAREIQERKNIQKALLETVDREQRRIGRELHDGLCQHLTGTALAGHLLAQKVAAKSPEESAGAAHVVELVEQAIEITRHLSHQLDPVELMDGQVTGHFEELAAAASQRLKIACRFESKLAGPLPDADVATHLYRIIQEAIAVAAMRSHLTRIVIELDSTRDDIVLTIDDDGADLSEDLEEDAEARARAMAYRADLIGAVLKRETMGKGGRRLTCALVSRRKS